MSSVPWLVSPRAFVRACWAGHDHRGPLLSVLVGGMTLRLIDRLLYFQPIEKTFANVI